MSQDRPSIPAAIKRAVRKECGFGCVICGAPIFHYDHIVDFSEVKEHTIENLALLCPTHHQDKTSGRIPRGVVAKSRAAPVNLNREVAPAHKWFFDGAKVRFAIGGDLYETDFKTLNPSWGGEVFPIQIGNTPVFKAKYQDEGLLLSAIFHDAAGNLILSLDEGELRISTRVGDFSCEGRKLRMTDVDGNVLMELVKLDNGLKISRAIFREGGIVLDVQPELIRAMPGGLLGATGNVYINSRVGLRIG